MIVIFSKIAIISAYLFDFMEFLVIYCFLKHDLRIHKIVLSIITSCILTLASYSLGLELIVLLLFIYTYLGYSFITDKNSPLERIFLTLSGIFIIIIGDLTILITINTKKILHFSNNQMVIVSIAISIILTLLFLIIIAKSGLKNSSQFILDYDLTKYAARYSLLTFTVIVITKILFIILFPNMEYVEIIILLILFFLSMIGYLFYQAIQTVKLKTELNNQKQQELIFKDYLSEINENQQNILDFKHDYQNMLSTLGSRINILNDQELLAAYNQIIDYMHPVVELINLDKTLRTLELLPGNLVKSLIISKIYKANQAAIALEVDILGRIEQFPISEITLARMIGILLDNAIDSCKEYHNQQIALGFVDYGNKGIDIIIENYINSSTTDINHWFSQGFTTKKSHQGRGLAIIKQIVSENNTIDIEIDHCKDKVQVTLMLGV